MAIIGTEKETNKINTLYEIVNGTLAVKFQITSGRRNAKQEITTHLNL